MAKPSRISSSVCATCGHIVPSAHARTNRSNTVHGPGRTNDWKPDTKTTACHASDEDDEAQGDRPGEAEGAPAPGLRLGGDGR